MQLDRRTVGEEIDLAATSLLRCEQHPFDDVGDVTRRSRIAPAVDPHEAAGLHRFGKLHEHRGVVGAPDEARPHDHGLQRRAVRRLHDRFGGSLGRRIARVRMRGARTRFVDVDERRAIGEHGFGAHVHERSHAGLLRSVDDVARAVHVAAHELLFRPPLRDFCGDVMDDVAAAHARGHRGDVVEIAADRGRAERLERRVGLLAPRKRVHRVAARHQRADQIASDEARAAGDECARSHWIGSSCWSSSARIAAFICAARPGSRSTRLACSRGSAARS